MPCNKIKRTMILLKSVIQPVRLINHGPILMQIFINVRNRVQEIPRVRQSMTTKRTQVREFPSRSPYLGDVPSRNRMARAQTHSKADSARDYTDLARLDEQLPQLGLDIQVTQLRYYKEVSVRIAEGSVVHIGIDHEDI